MRTRRSVGIALAALLACGGAAAAEPGLADSLLARMAKAPPVATPFVQVSYRHILERPLVVSGTLRWLGAGEFERDITQPFTETAKIGDGELSVQRGAGAVRRIPLARAPQLGALLAGFHALLGGDAAALTPDFTVAATGDAARWSIELTPKHAALRQQLASIELTGAGTDADCLVLNDADGDASITLLGAFAATGIPDPAPPRAALLAQCRGAR